MRSSTQQGWAAEETVPEVLEARDWGERAGKLHPTEAKPADSEEQSQVSKDGCIQQEDDASQGKREGALKRRPQSAERPSLATSKGKRRRISASSRKTVQHNSKAWVAQRVPCKREASRTRRAIAADRSVKDIAKQVTMTRERRERES